MKTLYYLRHSIKDANNNISPVGIELAKAQGQCLIPTHGQPQKQGQINPYRVFVGPLPRTFQTCEAFFSHVTNRYVLADFVVEIKSIGDDELFKRIVTDGFKAAVKSGKSNLEALLEAHNGADIDLWKDIAFSTVEMMFGMMGDGETAVAFGHSPMIELAAYAIHTWKAVDIEYQLQYRRLGEMEGIVFIYNDPNKSDTVNGIGVLDRVSLPKQ